ncbi:MAG: hypothetical protein AB1779_07450, partial [Candidatus Thermoplasmatota archaeon]
MKKLLVFVIAILFLLPINLLSFGETRNNLDITETYIVKGVEYWDSVNVKGKLVIVSGATLRAENIYLFSGSILEMSGSIIMNNDDYGGDVRIEGSAEFLNISSGSIKMSGNYGGNTIQTSKGGDAILNITVTNSLDIRSSRIEIWGGGGYNLPPSTSSTSNAWNTNALGGYANAGGNAFFIINSLKWKIENTTILAYGGNGGKASDGGDASGDAIGKGGGYVNGGDVYDYVGSGGNVNIALFGKELTIYNSIIKAYAGNGGNAGNGGKGANAGGGGGGYAGGDGGYYDHSGLLNFRDAVGGDGFGGNVYGFVGS